MPVIILFVLEVKKNYLKFNCLHFDVVSVDDFVPVNVVHLEDEPQLLPLVPGLGQVVEPDHDLLERDLVVLVRVQHPEQVLRVLVHVPG